MEYRLAREEDFPQLAEMKWLHAWEDDLDYGESNLQGVDKAAFLQEFAAFLKHTGYRIFVASQGATVVSAMFVHLIPKVPKPNRKSSSIAYLTNVFTRREYRSQGVGSRLLAHIREQLTREQCELIFVWPSEKSVNWYCRNGFTPENEIFECPLNAE